MQNRYIMYTSSAALSNGYRTVLTHDPEAEYKRSFRYHWECANVVSFDCEVAASKGLSLAFFPETWLKHSKKNRI